MLFNYINGKLIFHYEDWGKTNKEFVTRCITHLGSKGSIYTVVIGAVVWLDLDSSTESISFHTSVEFSVSFPWLVFT